MRNSLQSKPSVGVAMSGGVDSSVTAALLRQQGFAVTGFFMKLAQPDFTQQLARVRQLAARLAVPLEVVDLSAEFATTVLDYFCATYFAGRTPNPCMVCNRTIKFGRLLEETLGRGLDGMATGHYARLAMDEAGNPALRRGLDPSKDQSYFLHRLSQDQLSRVEFPIGDLDKPQVRALAREFGLPVADKKDSVGLCFVGEVDMARFLSGRLSGRPGPIVTTAGQVVGRHDGLGPYTVGQRHGLGLGDGRPYFVIEQDPARNTLVVAEGEDPAELYSTGLVADDLRWVAGHQPDLPFSCRSRIRYRQPLQGCVVADGAESGQLFVSFAQPQRAVAPGQFVVFYSEDECLGGGRIVRAIP